MGRIEIRINNVKKTLIESVVNKQGDRGVDQSKFVVPPNVNANSNDTIEYIHDTADLTNLKAYWSFDHLAGDESGNQNHALGFANIPSHVSRWQFECDLLDTGLNNNTLQLSCCGTTTFAAGKVGCKAILFDGCTSFVAGECAEADYDFEHYQKSSGSLWFKLTSVACNQVFLSKQASACTVGFAVYFCTTNDHVEYRQSDGTCNFNVNTANCSVVINKWYNITWTNTGASNEIGMKVFLNGECDTNGAACAAISCTVRNSVDLTIGGYGCGTVKASCGTLIDAVYLFANKQLTSDQAARLYQEGALTYGAGKWGDAVTFDGCAGHLEIDDSSDFDLCGAFEGIFWLKSSSSCSVRTVFNKTGGCDTFDFKINACCKGVLRFGCTTLTTCTDIADCTFHQIRFRRDACCAMSLHVDNVSEATASCVCCDETSTVCFTFGRNESDAEYFSGAIDSFRWYKGGVLATRCLTNLFCKSNPITIMAFGGNVTKVEKEIKTKTILAQSFGKVLGDTEVDPTSYNCKSPEFIILDLITNNTNLKVVPHNVNSGISIGKYLADGKLIDLVDDLVSLIGATFRTHGLETFVLETKEFRIKTNKFTHGKNTRIWLTHFDDTELVNELTVLGENKRYQEIQTCCGDACKTVFTLNEAAVSIRVETPPGTEQIPEVDYILDSLGKTVTFCCAPACGCCNVVFDYEYEIPLYLKGKCQTSIDANGIHSKRLVLPWIREKNDGVRFISGYLSRYSEVRKNLTIEHPTMVTSLRENDVILVCHAIKGISCQTFVIKSIKYEYPAFITTIEVGEYSFDDFEYDKQVAQKIHDLEGAVSTIRDLRGFVNLTQVIPIVDTVAVNANIEAPETVAIADTACVTEIFDAVYSCSCTTYNGDDAYV